MHAGADLLPERVNTTPCGTQRAKAHGQILDRKSLTPFHSKREDPFDDFPSGKIEVAVELQG